MAKLQKLYINGIRSFGPNAEDTQQISFTNPVTLILGQNGCGKTTIIECIKYALTGDLPGGTTKGQGFVNDPKMSRVTTARGQIRIKLTDPKNWTYLVCKILQVTQKQQNLSFKSLDSTIKITKADGTEQTTSNRHVDIERLVAETMNLTPSILNNVIFCHQENSAWPLEEGQKLKDKFDEIFDATKYNDIVTHLRKYLKNEHKAKIEHSKYQVEFKKEKKELAQNKRTNLEQKRATLQTYEEQIEQKRTELAPIQNRLSEIYELLTQIEDLNKKLATKKEEKKGLENLQNTIKKNIEKEFEGTDDELKDEIQKFNVNQEKEESQINSLEQRKNDIETKEKSVSHTMQNLQVKIGALNEEKRQFEKLCSDRNTLISRAENLLELNLSPDFDDEESINETLSKFKSTIAENEEKLNQTIAKSREDENALQGKIDKAREELASLRENVKSRKINVEDYEQKIRDLNAQLEEISGADEKLSSINRKIKDCERSLEALKIKVNEHMEEAKIKKSKEDIQQMEAKLIDYENLYRLLQDNSVHEERIEAEETLKSQKEAQAKNLLSKNLKSLKTIFANKVPGFGLKERVQGVLNENEALFKQLSEKLVQKQKQVTTLEAQKANQEEKIHTAQRELQFNKEKMFSVCNGKSFNVYLKETYDSKELLQKKKGQLSSSKIIYEKFVDDFNSSKPCCPVCKTDFNNKRDLVQNIVTTLKGTISDVPRELKKVEDELKKLETLYNKLQQLKPVADNISKLEEHTLPTLAEDLKMLSNDYDLVSEQLTELKKSIEDPSLKVDLCKNVIPDMALYDQYRTDSINCQKAIDYAKGRIAPRITKLSKHELEAEIDSCKADLSEERKRSDTLKLKLDQHRSCCQKIRENRNGLVEEKMQFQGKANNKPLLEKQCEEHQEQVMVLKCIIMEQESELNNSESKLRELNLEKQALILQNQTNLNTERSKSEAKKKIVDDVYKITTHIKDLTKNDTDSELEQKLEELADVKHKLETLITTKNTVSDAISAKKTQLAQKTSNLRALQDNIVLRENRKMSAKVDVVINDLEKQIGNSNYQTIDRERQRISHRHEDLDREINQLSGQEGEISNLIRELENELEKPEYKFANKNYLEALYHYKIVQAVKIDLEKYTKALEDSIIQFHKERMVQINETIRELWRTIYRGNDIDYIEIKTQEMKTTSAKRAYNYKVVQVKSGIELEMRGRCSAGQRVLACLVIRMALAESFSTQCGILSLDEPTTNLDRENIISLTQALVDLINSRKDENNFQLIIITHDQDFLDGLRHAQSVSHYWKVYRNDRGFSEIKKELI